MCLTIILQFNFFECIKAIVLIIATDVDEYITAESVDYDPISDDELDALIEEPEESLPKFQVEGEKSSK